MINKPKVTITQDLINYLQAIPGQIEQAEQSVLIAQEAIFTAKDVLSAKEAELYSEGKIDGKNAEIRSSQLKQLTVPERNELVKAENDIAQARIKLTRLQNNFAAYRAIAGLLKAGE